MVIESFGVEVFMWILLGEIDEKYRNILEIN